MIDWHSHILSNVDDGSKNVSESLEMLRIMSRQGVDKVVATPHFYADDESVDSFLERRNNAYCKLEKALEESKDLFGGLKAPEIILGAEVKYYNGISRLAELNKLAFQNRKLLMIEMSMSRWTEYTVKEIVELSQNHSLTVIIAHVERYASFQSFETMERLYESGVLMQVNSSFFTSFSTKRKAIKMLEQGDIHLIGSDCHNLTSRPPTLKNAFDYIEKKLGENFSRQFNEYGERIFSKLNEC